MAQLDFEDPVVLASVSEYRERQHTRPVRFDNTTRSVKNAMTTLNKSLANYIVDGQHHLDDLSTPLLFQQQLVQFNEYLNMPQSKSKRHRDRDYLIYQLASYWEDQTGQPWGYTTDPDSGRIEKSEALTWIQDCLTHHNVAPPPNLERTKEILLYNRGDVVKKNSLTSHPEA
ncbi:MAG: hypothetical protein HON68_03145 [Gammaproteobacteria bacterium]|nr:hypothetical protein [Gammaproteobacteria bacterium]MBT4132009.1 hypothetical protein [Candidatus Neomarinimicrobiota bacterium]MBT4330812.1 hypothetical protein [Gammaproteobacteria bacterium]MBT4788108.1 hypothetical protein [Gammaproteobacteria bacterium]MBT5370715.1 hypothetical protein [Gammaproteobacteria bacterium]